MRVIESGVGLCGLESWKNLRIIVEMDIVIIIYCMKKQFKYPLDLQNHLCKIISSKSLFIRLKIKTLIFYISFFHWNSKYWNPIYRFRVISGWRDKNTLRVIARISGGSDSTSSESTVNLNLFLLSWGFAFLTGSDKLCRLWVHSISHHHSDTALISSDLLSSLEHPVFSAPSQLWPSMPVFCLNSRMVGIS